MTILRTLRLLLFILIGTVDYSPTAVLCAHQEARDETSAVNSGVKCPTLYFHDVKVLDSITLMEKNEPAAVGEKVLLVCEEGYSEHDVFPAPKRTCQHDGTWSSYDVTPGCVNIKHQAKPINSVGKYCGAEKSSDCNQLLKRGKKVGKKFNPQGKFASDILLQFDENNGYEIQEVLYRFSKRIFLSFITFNVPVDSYGKQKNYLVEIYVAPKDVLHDTNSTLQWKHFDLFRRSENGLRASSRDAIVDIGAYVDQVLVRFITVEEKGHGDKFNSKIFNYSWIPAPRFFPILQPKTYESCPREPKIADATILDRSRRSVSYKCREGFRMLEVFSGESLNYGIVECLNGNWELQPFPICRAINTQSKGSVEIKKDETMKNSFTISPSNKPEYSESTYISNDPLFTEHLKAYLTEDVERSEEAQKQPNYLVFVLTALILLAVGLLSSIVVWVICILLRTKPIFRQSDGSQPSSEPYRQFIISTKFFGAGKYSTIYQDGKSPDHEYVYVTL